MSRSKFGHSTLSGLIDSDSDDSQFVVSISTPDSAAQRVSGKIVGGRSKPGPSKVTKTKAPKAPARRLSGRLMARSKASKTTEPVSSKSKRKVLGDRTDQQRIEEMQEVDEFQVEDIEMGDELDATVIAAKENNPRVTKQKVPNTLVVTKKKAPARRTHTESVEKSPVVLESQFPEAEMEDTRVDEETGKPFSKPAHTIRPRERSRPHQPSAQRRRAGSTSDTERSDPVLRRKLGDLTKKHDSLSIRYQDLREIGLKEAEQNFERLKKQKEQDRAKSEKLIAALKNDAASNASSFKEARDLKKKIQSQATEISTLQAQITQLKASVAETQSENKALSAKLAANRSAAAEIANINAQGTAASGGVRVMGGTDGVTQLKENLYSDLTGLIIRSVKQEAEDNVFDCIQTGRNGRALHFKLAVTNDKNESYDDATCSYVPQLDSSRDKDLMELLPDYLIEEITFPRPQAARFYARVGKALTEQA